MRTFLFSSLPNHPFISSAGDFFYFVKTHSSCLYFAFTPTHFYPIDPHQYTHFQNIDSTMYAHLLFKTHPNRFKICNLRFYWSTPLGGHQFLTPQVKTGCGRVMTLYLGKINAAIVSGRCQSISMPIFEQMDIYFFIVWYRKIVFRAWSPKDPGKIQWKLFIQRSHPSLGIETAVFVRSA